ncbi:interleukin-5 receptor subunit alpha-like [Hypanus sabinus]|uniref:interleukin-5 receptor subunit alpha-like n=1 Tax=Hypanus sabinus TaxID=79690 RepID=UPI0028C47762|nr:interleukin-5 receptor subunit alpha-like [Hypanus sabinus]
MSLILPSLQLVFIWMITMNGSPSASAVEMGNLSFSIRNMSWLFYNENHMTCTWDVVGTAPPETQYCLSYGLGNQVHFAPCHKIELGKVACHVHSFKEYPFDSISFCAIGSSQQSNATHCRDIVPVLYYKVSRPVNVTVNGSEVVWEPPIGKHPSGRFNYQIQVKDLRSKGTKVEDLHLAKWAIKDLTRNYAVQVRARIEHFLEQEAKDFVWSDWTDSVTTGEEQAISTTLKSFIVTIVIIFLLVVLLMFIYIRCKTLRCLGQQIPEPKQKFHGLFENYNGDFQKWINASHPETMDPKECDIAIVED